jgi:hypothetical protein
VPASTPAWSKGSEPLDGELVFPKKSTISAGSTEPLLRQFRRFNTRAYHLLVYFCEDKVQLRRTLNGRVQCLLASRSLIMDAQSGDKLTAQLLDEAESLIWAMLDDRIADADLARLTKLLQDYAAVRSRYVDCVRLHVDLTEHFGRKANDKPAPTVLANLSPGSPGILGVPSVPQ